ncbi:hypothetical protein NEOLI_004890, partial [Neolecta irregularis DAH-3]
MESVERTVTIPKMIWKEIFKFLPEFGVLICLEHRSGIRPSHLDLHISTKHGIFRGKKKRLLEELSHLEIRNPTDIVYPGRITTAIKELNIIDQNAFQCRAEGCNYCCIGLKRIKLHSRLEHQWKNEKDSNPVWEEAILQTFFAHKSFLKYFRVLVADSRVIDNSVISSIKETTLQTFRDSQTLLIKRHMSIQPIEHNSENTPWMQKTGYREYLHGLPWADIIKAYQLPNTRSNETSLEAICRSIDRLLNKSLKSARHERGKGKLTFANARILNTFQSGTMSQKPFKVLQNEDTARSYFAIWKKLICFIYRIQCNNLFPGIAIFNLTPQQLIHINTTFSCPSDNESLDQACLSMSYSLIAHTLEFNVFESPIISFSAALSLNTNGSNFLEPHKFTPYLSKLIYCIQLIVLEYNLINYDLLKEDNQSFQSYFQIDCEKWILNTTDGPMSELLSNRLYGMAIGRTTVAPMTTYWDEAREVITYRCTELAMSDLRRFMAEQVFAATYTLKEKLLFDYNPLLKFDFLGMKDDFGQKNIGESFLTNEINGFKGSSEWLLQSILNDPVRLEAMAYYTTGSKLVWKSHIVQQYEYQVQRFLDHLLILIHMGSGQP